MYITMFNKKKSDRIRYIKRNNIRKPDLDPNKVEKLLQEKESTEKKLSLKKAL